MHNAMKAQRNPDLIPQARHHINVGTLRAYIVAHLSQHPQIHQDMTLIARQLEPGPDGLPMQIYAFFNETPNGVTTKLSRPTSLMTSSPSCPTSASE